jgi:hypothetical protein
MASELKRLVNLQLFKSIRHDKIKFQAPLIFRMYGALNDLNLRRENRYILCNFIDQNSAKFNFQGDIYKKNHKYSLNQLFIYALNKAKEHDLLVALYDEYINSINAISQKELK